MSKQLSLFEEPEPPLSRTSREFGSPRRASVRDAVPARRPEVDALARALPPWLHLGTSSWSFPGWRGLVWNDAHSEAELAQSGLNAYARIPLFRTVGVDRSYYRPLRAADMALYAAQIQSAASAAQPHASPFRLVLKAWDQITTAVFPKHPRYGSHAGTPNVWFLNPERFVTDVLTPCIPHAHAIGAFVLELTPMPKGFLTPEVLSARIRAFVRALPALPFPLAFELRNAELLTERWFNDLRDLGAGHVFNFWTAMPVLRTQLRAHGSLRDAPCVVVRLMLAPYASYAASKAAFAPFDKLVAPQADMIDDVVAIVDASRAAGGKPTFIVANNKAEGSAPLTIERIASRVSRLTLASTP